MLTPIPHPVLFNKPNRTLIDTIRNLGLADNLKLCLDAGDVVSYASGQSWLDRSGNGHDFFLGADGSATATDPTFNGIAGNKSSNEYFSFDGGDYFTYDTTNETWMENIHKDNAIFTICAWVYFAAAGDTGTIFGDRGAAAGNTGFIFRKAVGDVLAFNVQNAGAAVLALSTVGTVPTGWTFAAISFNEATGANGASLIVNTTEELFTSTYSSPSAGAASFTMQIAAGGNVAGVFVNNARLGGLMAWEGTALTMAQIMTIYQATRGRYGV